MLCVELMHRTLNNWANLARYLDYDALANF